MKVGATWGKPRFWGHGPPFRYRNATVLEGLREYTLTSSIYDYCVVLHISSCVYRTNAE